MVGNIKMRDLMTLSVLTALGCFLGTFLGVSMWDMMHTSDIHEIRTCQDLMDINKDLDGTYILMNDIECGEYLNDK
jgi:hypothetical protein